MDLSGNKYNKLLVLNFVRRNPKNKMAFYACKCDCGTIKVISHGNLRTGHSQSCGCLRKEPEHNRTTHGMSGTKVFAAWNRIKDRCFNPTSQDYYNYGGLGITMSDNLRRDFTTFYKEVGDPPSSGHQWSIDRIDNTRGYIEGNIRWASINQQARNKSLFPSNSSGYCGVQWYHSGKPTHSTYAAATWSSLDESKPLNKKFSVKKHGLLPAFALAVEYRNKMIAELNQAGAGYSEQHGLQKTVINS